MIEPLTKRELEILEWVFKGKTNEEIGMILGISAHTAKNHLRSVAEKMDVSTRTGMVYEGLRLGLLQAPEVIAQ